MITREKVNASVKLQLMEEGMQKRMKEDIRLDREGHQDRPSIIDEQKQNVKMMFEVAEITVLRWRKGGGRAESSSPHNTKLVDKV